MLPAPLKTASPRRKLRDVVADRLRDYIIAERLAPGDRLPTETELAQRFGVSRLSLREATKALEFLGIVESKTGVGLSIGQMDLARVTGQLGFHPALHGASAEQLIESRIVLETGVLPFVARRMQTEPAIDAALSAIVLQFRSTRQLQAWIELDIAFHRTLLEASGLTPLVAFNDLLQVFFQRFRDSVKKAEWQAAIASHQTLLDLLRLGQVDAAQRELTAHIASHKQRLESAS
jgi:DNA-binding FadR family transcriptional regulator